MPVNDSIYVPVKNSLIKQWASMPSIVRYCVELSRSEYNSLQFLKMFTQECFSRRWAI